MNAASPSNPDKQFVSVEILDFNKEPVLAKELTEYYRSLDPERATWPPDKFERLVVRTECKWGRVPVGESLFMLNEFAEGPKQPLSKTAVATVKFYAELRPSGENAGDGFIEQAPFCQVQFDDESCRKLRAQGMVKLEEFIRRTIPQYADAFREWQTLIIGARENLIAFRKRQQKHEPQRQTVSEGEGEDQGSAGPRL